MKLTVGLDMDSVGLQDLVLGGRGLATSRPTPAKRQRMGASSTLVSNDSSNCNLRGAGDGGGAARCMGKARGSKGRLGHSVADGEVSGSGGSEGDDGEPSKSPVTTTSTPSSSLTARKRVRLNGKVVEDCDAVDPASVPRKLRSAINKRSRQSVSPLLKYAHGRKKHHHISNGIRFNHNSLLHSITEDEKEVVEALFALSRMTPPTQVAEKKKEKKSSAGISSNNAISANMPEVPGEDNILQHCAPGAATGETAKGEPVLLEKLVAGSGPQAVESDSYRSPRHDCSKATRLKKRESPNGNSSKSAVNASMSLGVSPHDYFGKGILQPTQHDEVAIFPSGSPGPALVPHDLRSVKQKTESNTKLLCLEEAAPNMQDGLPSSAHGQLKMLSSSRSAVCPGSATSALKPSLICSNLPTKKISTLTLDETRSWKRCAIHIGISHLIRKYQEKEQEKRKSLSLASCVPKSKEPPELRVVPASETPKLQNVMSSILPVAAIGSLSKRNVHETNNGMFLSGKFRHAAQQSSILPQTYSQQKQTCDFLSLAIKSEASSSAGPSGNSLKSSVQLHAPFLHSQGPHSSVMPFPFPHVPYTSTSIEKLAATATQQVQLQVPHYVSNSFYGQQIATAKLHQQYQQQQQQQQMWLQAHVSLYNSSMGMALLQNGQQSDPSSLRPSTQS